MAVQVRKNTGEIEEFSEEKLRDSLKKVGASASLVDHTLAIVRKKLNKNFTSEKIYREAFKTLRKQARHLAARYSLKKALMLLGPSGYPFEKLIASLLELQGYTTKNNLSLPGKCVTHELDVMAEKKDHRILVECKFKNQPHAKVDIKTALYIRARALDLKQAKNGVKFDQFWLVTNNRFTSDAIRYGRCENLTLLGWDFPEKKSLQDMIYMGQVHPVTCLTSLGKNHKKMLLQEGVILCRDLRENFEMIESLRLKRRQYSQLFEEIDNLLQYPF